MKRVALALLAIAGLVGGAASAVAASGGTFELIAGGFGFEYDDAGWTASAAAAFALVPTAVLMYAFRVVGLRADASRWRVEMALGVPRGRVTRGELFAGLRHGAIAGGAGLLLGAGAASLWPGIDPTARPDAVVLLVGGLLSFLAILTVIASMAYQAAADRVTSAAYLESLSPALEPTPMTSSLEGTSRRVAGAVLTISVLVLVADRCWPAESWTLLPFGAGIRILALVAASVVVWSFADRVLVDAPRRLAAALGKTLAAGTHRRAHSASVALTLVGEALLRHSALRRLSTLITTGLIAAVAFASANHAISEAREVTEARYTPFAAVSTSGWDESLAPGVVGGALPDDVAAAVVDDTRVVAVSAGMIVTSATDDSPDGDASTADGGERILVVDPTDLEAVSRSGLRPLGFQDGTLTSIGDGTASIGNEKVFRIDATSVEPMVTLAWAEATYGDIPASSMLLWPADTTLTDDEAFAVLDRVLADAGVDAADLGVLMGSASSESGSVSLTAWIAIGAPFLLLGVGLTVALAASSARDSRRDLATMAALGASPRALRLIPALESALTIASATVVGTAVGATASILASHPTLLKSGAPLDPVETLWGLGWELGQVPWGVPLAVGAAALVGGVFVALILGTDMAKGTPVDELRTADKEGLL